MDARLLDLRDFPMPFFDHPLTPGMPGRPPYGGEVVQRGTEAIAQSDGFVFVTPEYNHGLPAVPAAGGVRSVEQLRQIIVTLHMTPLCSAVHIPIDTLRAHSQGGNVEAGLAELDIPAKILLDHLLWWTSVLRHARTRAA